MVSEKTRFMDGRTDGHSRYLNSSTDVDTVKQSKKILKEAILVYFSTPNEEKPKFHILQNRL